MSHNRSAKRTTIREVAAAAGVSVATVSRVLSGNDYPVTNRLRSKVMRAVRELDYVANAHARALSGRRPKTVAMITESMDSALCCRIAQGVAAEAARADRLCLYADSHGQAETELALMSMVREQQADAVILIGGVVPTPEHSEHIGRCAAALAAAGSRLVLCGRPGIEPVPATVVVDYDNAEGAFAVTSHLLSRGHRRILHLAGSAGHTTAVDRLRGFRRALAEHGIDEDPSLVVHPPSRWPAHGPALGDAVRASGFARVRDRLAGNHGRPDFTAVVAVDDLVAAGALRALTAAGLRVPDDVSVVGYNDTAPAPDTAPALTTVHIPAVELGRTAVRLALSSSPPGEPVILGTHIVVRESVASRLPVPRIATDSGGDNASSRAASVPDRSSSTG